MVRFHELAGIPCYYARINPAYADLARTTGRSEKARTRSLAAAFKRRLSVAISEIYWLTSGRFGPLDAIVSGGAYVDKPGFHREGRAFDLGALHWPATKLVLIRTARDYEAPAMAEDWPLYLAVEAMLRRHFGTVLGILHDRRHHNHWHIDPGTPVGFWSAGFGAASRVSYLQASLTAIWDRYSGIVDGDYGPRTRRGVVAVRRDLSLGPLTKMETWQQYLLLTAAAGLQL